MNRREYEECWDRLSARQQEWVRGKANWEHMGTFAVMNEWGVPHDNELEPDGTARNWADMVRDWLAAESAARGSLERFEWYCIRCDEIVDGQSVSFLEYHVGCGCPVIEMRDSDITAFRAVVENPEKYILTATEKRCGNCANVEEFHDGISLTWGCKIHSEYGGRKKRGPCGDWQHNLEVERKEKER